MPDDSQLSPEVREKLEPLGCGMKQKGHTAGQFGGVARFEQFGLGVAKARL